MTTPPDALALMHLTAPVPLVPPSVAQVQTWLMAEINLPRLAGMLMSAREINAKLYALWLKLDEQQLTASAALVEFQAWVEDHTDLIDTYKDAREEMFKQLAPGGGDTRARKISRARSVAMAEAFEETKRHPHGPDQHTGKTVACFVLVSHPATYWIGHSGFGHHQHGSHLRMNTLLDGVHQVEEWGISVCSEVDCMKQALHAGAAEDDLVWYCFTWNAQKSRWTGRSACGNCRQWLAKLVLRMQ